MGYLSKFNLNGKSGKLKVGASVTTGDRLPENEVTHHQKVPPFVADFQQA
jgi:hypothetical protein